MKAKTRILDALQAVWCWRLAAAIEAMGSERRRTASVEGWIAHVTIKNPQRRGQGEALGFYGLDDCERHRCRRRPSWSMAPRLISSGGCLMAAAERVYAAVENTRLYVQRGIDAQASKSRCRLYSFARDLLTA